MLSHIHKSMLTKLIISQLKVVKLIKEWHVWIT